MRKFFYLSALFFCTSHLKAQKDSVSDNSSANELIKIVNEIKAYKPDTSDVPNDKITRKIIELRNLRGGFNINTVMEYKIHEDEGKDEKSKKTASILKEQFHNGKAKKWLDNSIIWIYRKEFTYKELKQLVRFYKTSAGQKFSEKNLPLLLKSVVAAESIQKQIIADIK
jgi:uncharacterized protein